MRYLGVRFSTRAGASASRIAIGVSAAVLAVPQASAAASGSGGGQPVDPTQEEIVIYGVPVFRDIAPERSLDEDAIESYGVSTVDELLGEVQVELGGDADQPMIIVNGQRLNDPSEIGGLPVETLRNVQVLPRGSALRMGGTSNQRVISLTLKRMTRSATATAAHKISTDGDWNGDRGEGILTYVRGDTRANLTLRARDDARLFEADRDIIQPVPTRPYAIGGNIVGYPGSGEIDPVLSAIAGQPVTVVPLPAGTPTLAQLASSANQANTTDLGLFRTLRPDTRNYDINGTLAGRLAPWLTANATLRWSRNRSESLRGLPSSLFVLSADNPASPFSGNVGIAKYGLTPLTYNSRRNNREAIVTFDANWGSWQGNLNLRNGLSNDASRSERQSSFGGIPLDLSVNPFTTDLSGLITLRTDRTSARSSNSLAELNFNGPLFNLPAGPILGTVEGRIVWTRLRSESTFSTLGKRSFRRDEQALRGAVEVPLTSVDNHFMEAVGDLSASLEYARAHYSDAGTVNHYTYGLTWQPRPILRLHAAIDETSLPAPIQTIGNPINITPAVRTFDPLTGQTVDVTQIIGGNPALLPQKTRMRNVSAQLTLVPRLKLQLNAEYTDTDLRNFVSSLPEASAAVMLAFPDRFIRDSNGVLTTVDLRPVNFDSHREKRLRWGLSMNAKVAGPAPGAARIKGSPARPSTNFQLTANHSMVFSDTIVLRPGLDPVDLLNGGALGIGGGRVRHQFDGTASLNSGGVGARLGVAWRGASKLDTRIGGVSDRLRFSPLMLVNLRAFADMKRFLPNSPWARGLRVSLDAINITNDRQQVRASGGNTPLQYQPGYRDPLGRTIELEIRKVF